MKKTIKLAVTMLAALAATTACNLDPVRIDRPGDGDTIRFTTGLVCTLTKSFSEATVSGMQSGGFKAAALYDSDGTAMFNEEFVYDGGTASYGAQSRRYLYPATGTLSFYGVYPASQTITVSGGKASLAYTQNSDTDLVAASSLHVSSQPTAVQMNFRHILSQASFTAVGSQDNVTFKVTSLKVTAADGGTYSFENDSWALSGTSGEYPVISATAIIGDSKTTVGSPMSFLPGDAELYVAWECYSKGNGVKICEKNATVDIELERGVNTVFNITLPYSSSEILLDISMYDWTSAGGSLSFTKDVSATYSVSGMTSASLPVATLSAGAAVRVDWGDGISETFQASSSKQMTFAHTYASSYTGTIGFMVYAGTVNFGEVSASVYQSFSVNDTEHFLITKKVFFFTVNSSSKKVIFSPGNLYWDGSSYKFEANEYDYPTSWDENHVGHFYWSKTASVARAQSYSDWFLTTSDTFFAADGGAIDGWTVLSKDEWDYVIANHMGKNKVSINGKNCAVLVPDGVAASVVLSSYTAAQWADAKEQYGLVALPFAGNRNGASFNDGGSYGDYWSSTLLSSDNAYYMAFDLGSAYMCNLNRGGFGFSVRLVKVQ